MPKSDLTPLAESILEALRPLDLTWAQRVAAITAVLEHHHVIINPPRSLRR